MILLKNGRFYLGPVSFPVPDGLYLNMNSAVQMERGLELVDCREGWSLALMLLKTENDAWSNMQLFCEESPERNGMRPRQVSIGKLLGYEVISAPQERPYVGMAFNVSHEKESYLLLYGILRAGDEKQLRELLYKGRVRQILEQICLY